MNVLLLWVLAVASPAAEPASGNATSNPNATYKIAPQFQLGQEFIYRGTQTEMLQGAEQGMVRFRQPYDLEVRFLIIEVNNLRQTEAGATTTFRLPNQQRSRESMKDLEDVVSLHFDRVLIAPNGTTTWASNQTPVVPAPDGASVFELGFLQEMPEKPIKLGEKWIVRKPGEPTCECWAVELETVVGEPCVKILCQQRSQNWMQKEQKFPAWTLQSTLWAHAKTGIIQRVERRYEMRSVDSNEPYKLLQTQYDLISNTRHFGPQHQEYVADFYAVEKAQNKLEMLFANRTRPARTHFTDIKSELTTSLNMYAETPYRLALKHFLEVAERCEQNPELVVPPTLLNAVTIHARPGKPALHFAFKSVETDEEFSLKTIRGVPALMVLIDPESNLALQALTAAIEAKTEFPQYRLFVLYPKAIPATAAELKAKYPGDYTICSGPAFDHRYGIKGVPHTLAIDAAGKVVVNFTGYGPELLQLLNEAGKMVRETQQADTLASEAPANPTK